MDIHKTLYEAASLILNARYLTAFTGAGISVESGIPPFRGEGGIWEKYNPSLLELDYFKSHPRQCWPVIREIFYDFFGKAVPNPAHRILADWEKTGKLKKLITQNIDSLHYDAGSRNVAEFHGNSRHLDCLRCSSRFEIREIMLSNEVPLCPDCQGILKPGFIFFGEDIPHEAYHAAIEAAERSDVMLVTGTTGEVMPAAQIPVIVRNHGGVVIEINPRTSMYTGRISQLYIPLKASEGLQQLDALIQSAG